nr:MULTISPECIES: CAP domain-containing protein [unclassified Paenibacillus]
MVLTGVLALGPIISAGVVSAAPSYSVSGNDTMWKISQKYGVSLASLIAANPQVANPNIIWPGIVLNIPGKAAGIGTGSGSQQGTGSTTQSSYASQVVSLVNQERAKAGLQPLASDSALTKVALDKAKDMYNNGYFDHTSPTYGSPFDMMRSYGIRYSYAGENIAKGQRTPQEVMNAWMNSPGHRQNIMSPNFNKIGVAYYNGVWVQLFIKN